MSRQSAINVTEISDKARRDLLRLLESVSAPWAGLQASSLLFQVRGKKNLVLEKSLAAPLGLYVKPSTLQEYGVDRIFYLESDNVDSSQRNVVFLTRGENPSTVSTVAGESTSFIRVAIHAFHSGHKVDCADRFHSA